MTNHDSDCSINNRGCPEILGPCDCPAKAAPVAEAVACWLKSNHPGADYVALGKPEDIHAASTDTKIPLYTSPPHDAELVELLRMVSDSRSLSPQLTDSDFARIDTYLATLPRT